MYSLIIWPPSASCPAALPPLVEDHRAYDDRALDHLLIVGIQPDRGEARDDHREDHGAEHRAYDRTAPARQRYAADNRHGDGVELVHHAHAGLRRKVLGGQ